MVIPSLPSSCLPRSKQRRAAAERTLCNSLTLAVACGLVVGTVLLTCGRTLLAGMGTAPELMQPAWEYLSFRWGSQRHFQD